MTTSFDFDTVIPREETMCVKFERRKKLFGNESAIPLWIADMDFPAAPVILKALSDRLSHGIMGYTLFTENLREAFREWVSSHHEWTIENRWICYVPAVVPAIGLLIQEFTSPGDRIVYLSPGYPPFQNSIVKNGRTPEASPLVYDGTSFTPDFDDLSERLALSKAFILCNPHNPTGRVWTIEELRRMADLCRRHNVLVISDEIHWDIVYPPARHTPFTSVSPENSILLTAPGKTFNLTGLPMGFAVIPEPKKRERVLQKIASLHLDDGNCLSLIAAEAAYGKGEPWLQELIPYLMGNVEYIQTELAKRLPPVRLVTPEGTFIPLMDFSGLDIPHEEIRDRLIHKAGVIFNDGLSFGPEGKGFFRINIATPRSVLTEAIDSVIRTFA